ncbi:PREDICTED: uncharacterized protein LOC108546011 [Eufriesea mexicana]|uniref:uncharacterized protein LOC108546011 n=1 Tax=Eufriesea mexicana TaxID=516756 RepID=UPI00083C3343|nr:PREDICTED: uncharacterized protein LOC108546011 [Eufriesea mexicana]
MDPNTVEKRFLKVNRAFGIITGVWPYQSARSKLMGRIMTVTVISTSILTQTAFLISFPSLDGAIMSMPYYILVLGSLVKMGNYFLDEMKLTSLINNIFDDWAAIKSKEEYDIMVTYSQRGLYITISYFLHVLATGSLMISWPFVSTILDLVKPLNESRGHMLIYPAYYWLDDEKYYVLILGHMIIILFMLGCIYCACDTNYVYAVQHACGLLAIAKHRFTTVNKNLPDSYQKNNSRLLEKVRYENVCNSIKAHQHAMKLVLLFMNCQICHLTRIVPFIANPEGV